MNQDNYKHCEICGAVLVRKLGTDVVFCQLCGLSDNKESKSEDVNYIG